eukprot:scaffold34650_cov47-Phaeocystis_antarctica.AAC.1
MGETEPRGRAATASGASGRAAGASKRHSSCTRGNQRGSATGGHTPSSGAAWSSRSARPSQSPPCRQTGWA